MNNGSQPSVNSFCCISTVALACRDGTTKGLFIRRVILLTSGDSGTVVGRTSRSSIFLTPFSPVQNSLSTPRFSRLLPCPLSRNSSSRTWGRPRWDPHVCPPPRSALQLSPEVEHHQLWVLHVPKEYRVAHPRCQLFLPAPVQLRPI